jgi:hypothetical protein
MMQTVQTPRKPECYAIVRTLWNLHVGECCIPKLDYPSCNSYTFWKHYGIFFSDVNRVPTEAIQWDARVLPCTTWQTLVFI